jgi:hypothetical protein
MNSKLIVVVLAVVVSGCQLSVRLGADGTFVPHSHEPIAAPTPTAAEVATKADTDNAPVCPSVNAVAECPAAEPVLKAASDTQTSPAAVSPPEANPVAGESQTPQSQESQSQTAQPPEQNLEQQAQPEQTDTTDVAVDDKPSALAETFDIEKYVEQSASCVQQHPCSQAQQENSSPTPKVVDEPKKVEPAKVVEQAKPVELVIDRKAVTVESGIQRVDRKRAVPVRVEVPPDMPR